MTELGASSDVEVVCMNPQDPDQDKLAAYRKVHPHGTVPCLEIEGRTPIIESGAICLYLADVYGNLGPDLDKEAYYSWLLYAVSSLDEVMENILIQWLFTPLENQDNELIHIDKMVRNWLLYAVSSLDEVMENILIQWLFTPLENQDNELIDKMIRKFETFAKHLSKWLETRDYICGNRLTAADCVLGYNLWWASAMRDGVLLRNFPVVRAYYERLQRRSAFQRTFIEEEENSPS